jgi:phospholipid/cholesterol/gamma-HCH transport system ATP-binding protein
VITLGRPTSSIVDADVWLKFVEQFGFVSDRIALLDGMTAGQNLAIPFSLDIDPIPPDIQSQVNTLAAEVGIAPSDLAIRVGEGSASVRARVRLARALALDPLVVVLEHPTAVLPQEEVKPYAGMLAQICDKRRLTMVALSMDEKFGKALGGRLLVWQPATGEFKERRRWWFSGSA